MPGDVSGGDVKGTAGYQPENLSAVGLQYLILSIALGKLAGSLAYFLCGMAAGMMLESEQAAFLWVQR